MDIDIDFKPSFDIKSVFPEAILCSMVKDNKLVKHPCGAYFQTAPIDPITNLSAIPFKNAGEFGLFKVDFLSLNLLEPIHSKQQIRQLINKDPDWSMLEDENIVSQLFQAHNHYDTIQQIKPQSVDELADTLAIIRPQKRKYLQQYIKDKTKIRPLLYRTEQDDKSSFTRGHAIAYALTIVVQLHTLKSNF